MDQDRMDCLRLALGSRMDAKPLSPQEATDAIAVAEQLYTWACQPDPADANGQGDGTPVVIEGVMNIPSAAGYIGLDG